MNVKVIYFLFFVALTNVGNAQLFFKCFECDTDHKIKFSIEYSGDQPKKIRYIGQSASMLLNPIKGSLHFVEGSSAFSESFNEILDGNINGKYTITHSGNWDYVVYERRDGRVFNFTINLDDSLSPDGRGFRVTPCY